MKLIALKTEDGKSKGDIAFYCRVLHVSRQGFYQYLANKDRAWKYQPLADAMLEILAEDECNDTYGRIRMYQALNLKQLQNVDIPSERTVYRVMEEIGISHRPRRKPNGITRADRQAHKSDDLLKRDFHAEKPLMKCVTDITEIKASDGKLYVSAVFDCFDSEYKVQNMEYPYDKKDNSPDQNIGHHKKSDRHKRCYRQHDPDLCPYIHSLSGDDPLHIIFVQL